MNARYHLEQGHADPSEHRTIYRQSTAHGGYITRRGHFRGGEEVTRLICTTTRRDGHRTQDTLTFRNELHARAWLRLLTQGKER